MTPELSLEVQLDLTLRLTVGLILGAVIGFERELHRQPAGFRTHSLVSLGAALFTIVSAYGFTGDQVDPTRIAAQIVSGIGFIGAGTILQHRGHIRGLTTAASLWSVAAIGTAAGARLYVVAIVGTLLILIILSILDRVETMARHRLQLPPEGFILPDERQPDDGKSEDLP
ncbi:MAG TPA: MgtC/SapB family protein [Candidatus Limnocylindria bacterium]|jgi:putative Mg2+ transporter-C (MgtC) family protein|nr:MgtC/SapB family protein [Candidatus Limnocylindria bacterium]